MLFEKKQEKGNKKWVKKNDCTTIKVKTEQRTMNNRKTGPTKKS